MQNKSGGFIEPCIAAFVPAVDGVTLPASLNTSLTDGSDPGVYPITGATCALVYENQTAGDGRRAGQLIRLGADQRART